MLRRNIRIVALASTLAAVGGASFATTVASAFTVNLSLGTLAVSGTLTPKKLNQPVTLPEGSSFTGQTTLELPGWSGPITGNILVPPFNTTISLAGVPTTVGLTFTETAPIQGSFVQDKSGTCSWAEPSLICLTMSVPTSANVGITAVGVNVLGVLGVTTTTECETVEPITLPLSTTLTLAELLSVGAHFSGTTTIPPIKCAGLDGPAVAAALTTAMSGPENAYALQIAAPVGKGF